MIHSETLVQISKSGECRVAGDLQIGDTVYDWLANCDSRIVNILRRHVDTSEKPDLNPVRIKWGECGSNIPSRDVIVSRHQQVLNVTRSRQNSYPALIEPVPACKLVRALPSISKRKVEGLEYIAIFFEAPTHMVCSKLILRGYRQPIPSVAEQKRALFSNCHTNRSRKSNYLDG